MNKQTNALVRGSKKVILGLLAISAFGMVASPARGDNAVVQDSIQRSINTGNGNTSIQKSSQESRINRPSRRGNTREQVSSGVIQTNEQVCDQFGDRNRCSQNSEMRSHIRYERRR